MKYCFWYFKSFCFLFVLFQYNIVWAEIQESRAILDESFGWETPEGAKKTLDRIKLAGFNVYIPRVWLGDGAFWPTNLVTSSPKWKYRPTTDYDPLKNLIRLAHDMDIEVHPWFTVMNRRKEFHKEFYDEGTPPHSFNVHVPEFRRFIVDLMLDVVQNYEVDGINLDFIRSKGFCSSKFCENNYRAKFNRDLQADVATYKNTDHFKVQKTVAWPFLMKWNRDSVTDIVKRFSVKAKKIKPNLIISIDTIVLIEDFLVQGADGVLWKNNGWIDVIYQMDYKKKLKIFLTVKAKKKLANPNSLMLLVGNVDWPNDDTSRGKEAFSRDAKLTADVLNVARSNGKGVAMWTYRFLTDDQIEKIKAGPFREVAKPMWDN